MGRSTGALRALYTSPSLQNRVTVPSLALCSLPLLSSSILVLHRASLCPPCHSISLSVPAPLSLTRSLLLSLSRFFACTPLRGCRGRGPTTREILFYPLPRSNSLGSTGDGDTRHTRGTRSRSSEHTREWSAGYCPTFQQRTRVTRGYPLPVFSVYLFLRPLLPPAVFRFSSSGYIPSQFFSDDARRILYRA